MGNEISLAQYKSMKNVLDYIAENRAHYDRKTTDRIFLDYQLYFSNVRVHSHLNGDKYIDLTKGQTNAYKRISKAIQTLEWKDQNEKETKEEENIVEETYKLEGSA